jgi:hypothetical protein
MVDSTEWKDMSSTGMMRGTCGMSGRGRKIGRQGSFGSGIGMGEGKRVEGWSGMMRGGDIGTRGEEGSGERGGMGRGGVRGMLLGLVVLGESPRAMVTTMIMRGEHEANEEETLITGATMKGERVVSGGVRTLTTRNSRKSCRLLRRKGSDLCRDLRSSSSSSSSKIGWDLLGRTIQSGSGRAPGAVVPPIEAGAVPHRRGRVGPHLLLQKLVADSSSSGRRCLSLMVVRSNSSSSAEASLLKKGRSSSRRRGMSRTASSNGIRISGECGSDPLTVTCRTSASHPGLTLTADVA